jgi:hypothetical protein
MRHWDTVIVDRQSDEVIGPFQSHYAAGQWIEEQVAETAARHSDFRIMDMRGPEEG